MTKAKSSVSISFVIPVKDEEKSLPILYRKLSEVIKKYSYSAEIIFIDDGSTDTSNRIIKTVAQRDARVRLITFRANYGKSAALSEGFKEARNDIIVMLDADLQDQSYEIPRLIRKVRSGYDLVTGWRKNRHDSISKKLSSKLFNAGTALITGIKLHDFNCGLKAMRKTVAKDLPMHGELHRFIPILAAKLKYRVAELPVRHGKRKYGISKYGFGRSWRGIIDLITTIFISDYSTKPAHFFGKIGLIFLIFGIGMDAYVALLKITTGTTQDKIPLLLAGILCIVVGVQLISTGLIAEFIVQHYMGKTVQRMIKDEH